MYKVPELAALGRVFRSTAPIELTESETEYVVSYVKHVMSDHVVLEFIITNTIADQLLVDACEMQRDVIAALLLLSKLCSGVSLEAADDSDAYLIEKSIHVPKLRCGGSFNALCTSVVNIL